MQKTLQSISTFVNRLYIVDGASVNETLDSAKGVDDP
jgi:hypothetical protein